MSAILKFDFQKKKKKKKRKERNHLFFSEESDLNYTKRDTILHVTIIFSLKQGQTRTSSGPIWVPLRKGW